MTTLTLERMRVSLQQVAKRQSDKSGDGQIARIALAAQAHVEYSSDIGTLDAVELRQ
jgi:hypothetical protein